MNNYKFLVYNALIPLLLVSFFLYGCTSVSPLNTPAINENLTPPSDIKALADINTIAFEWKLPSDPTIAGYHIYRKKPQDEDFQKIASINTRFSTHYTDTKLEPDTEYLYQFTSYDTHENRSPFSPVIFTKTHILEPVEYIEAIGNYPRMIKLIWNPHPDFRTIGYIIEKKDKNGKWKELTKIKNRLLVEFLDKNLQDNVTHEYRIFAYNTNETLSPASKLAIATTTPKPPAITMFEASTNLPRKITLQWEKHPNPEVTHYLLLRSSILGFSKLKTLDCILNTYTRPRDLNTSRM
ncbi:MAG: hypothetical protein K2I63_02415, partial [Helicobacter sp.]|nr:hypothetical protein [Helicobacter sp.]